MVNPFSLKKSPFSKWDKTFELWLKEEAEYDARREADVICSLLNQIRYGSNPFAHYEDMQHELYLLLKKIGWDKEELAKTWPWQKAERLFRNKRIVFRQAKIDKLEDELLEIKLIAKSF